MTTDDFGSGGVRGCQSPDGSGQSPEGKAEGFPTDFSSSLELSLDTNKAKKEKRKAIWKK